MKAAKEGKSVAVIEAPPGRWRLHPLGHYSIQKHCGTSSTGCWNSTRPRRFRNTLGSALKLSYPDLLRSAESVIARQTAMRREFYERNASALSRSPKFLDAHTLEVRAGNHSAPHPDRRRFRHRLRVSSSSAPGTSISSPPAFSTATPFSACLAHPAPSPFRRGRDRLRRPPVSFATWAARSLMDTPFAVAVFSMTEIARAQLSTCATKE